MNGTLFDRINAVLRSRELDLSGPVKHVEEEIVAAPMEALSQEEEMQARYGVPQEELDQVQLLKRKIIQDLLNNQEEAAEPLPQNIKGT